MKCQDFRNLFVLAFYFALFFAKFLKVVGEGQPICRKLLQTEMRLPGIFNVAFFPKLTKLSY